MYAMYYMAIKKLLVIIKLSRSFTYNSTREQIRTATPFPAPAPQAGASTNFATRV